MQGYEEAQGSRELVTADECPDLQSLLQRVKELGELGNHAGALHLLDTAGEAFPGNAQIETARGWTYENLGPLHHRRAGEAYAEALRLDPDILEAREGLANILFTRGNIDAAEQLYREVVDRVDASGDASLTALELQGWCLYKLGDLKRAVQVFTSALARDASLIAVRFDLALALLADGRATPATAEYVAALDTLRQLPLNRRIGPLTVALEDLEAAIDERSVVHGSTAAHKARRLLTSALAEAKAAAALHPAGGA